MAIVLKPVHVSGMDRPHENGVKKIRSNADKNTPLPEQAGAAGSLVDFRHWNGFLDFFMQP